MKIKLTEEQIDFIANKVIHKLGEKARRDITPKRSAILPGTGGSSGIFMGKTLVRGCDSAAGRDISLMLTVRSDLNAIVNAMSAGNGKHARRLAEELLVHVDETLEEL